MADNRIYIRCKGCGETLYLGKRIGSPEYYWRNYNSDGEHLEDRLNEFFEDHTYCGGAFNDFEIAYEDGYEEAMKQDNGYWVFKEGGLFEDDN